MYKLEIGRGIGEKELLGGLTDSYYIYKGESLDEALEKVKEFKTKIGVTELYQEEHWNGDVIEYYPATETPEERKERGCLLSLNSGNFASDVHMPIEKGAFKILIKQELGIDPDKYEIEEFYSGKEIGDNNEYYWKNQFVLKTNILNLDKDQVKSCFDEMKLKYDNLRKEKESWLKFFAEKYDGVVSKDMGNSVRFIGDDSHEKAKESLEDYLEKEIEHITKPGEKPTEDEVGFTEIDGGDGYEYKLFTCKYTDGTCIASVSSNVIWEHYDAN